MFGEYDPQLLSLQIEICTSKLIIRTMLKQQWDFEFTSRMFVWHVYLFMPDSQASIYQISVGNFVENQ